MLYYIIFFQNPLTDHQLSSYFTIEKARKMVVSPIDLVQSLLSFILRLANPIGGFTIDN